MCIPRPASRVECSCPDGNTLTLANNGKTCVVSNHSCSESEFVCQNGQCLQKRWVCDLDDDCSDNSDEDKNMCGWYIINVSNHRLFVHSAGHLLLNY